MRSFTMIITWKTVYCALLLALMGALGFGVSVQISWAGRVTAGSRTTFTCSSSCFPNCIYSWTFNGRTVNESAVTWTPDGQDVSVALQCIVLSPKTGISSSTTTIVEIWNPVSVRISPPNITPSLNKPLSLVCQDSASKDHQGLSDIVWYKDGQKVTLRENMRFLQNNLTLHFDSLLSSDAGFYQCEIYLQTSETRVYSMGFLLSFDPWNVTISGPDVVFPGRLSQFTCLSSCTLNVECTIRWQFRGGFPIGTYLSVNANHLKWIPSNPGTFQNFTCIAENNAAGRSAEDTKTVEVTGIPVSGSEALQLSGLSLLVFSFTQLLPAFQF
ncbi:carcinoembryonic antigen-related cell adhesion molecule 20-like [Girardinichthys multiradiatus]|uniref:carcinoembryonic antigen-related cell adhesion molecule 20-like n=1 Tax=Girardinichthys multiradiatus TaxID=208333 RepID=UPI001FAC6B03|nr:carcinoembryonic antigen-related cell adhesion molecule 20-like [Girardinichthys multiradiatus]